MSGPDCEKCRIHGGFCECDDKEPKLEWLTEEDAMTDAKVIQSYVWYNDKCFFVSTIERESSALVEPPPIRFNETITWEYNYEARERGRMLYMDADRKKSIETHFGICRKLYKTGTLSGLPC